MTNQSSDSVTFTDKTPISLAIRNVLTEAEFAAISLAANRWTAKWIPGRFANWSLIPTETLTLAPKDSIKFTLSNVKATSQDTSGFLDITYNHNPIQLPLSLINPPSPSHQNLDLQYGFLSSSPGVIYSSDNPQSPIENNLVLYLINPNPTTALKTSSSSKFLLSFVSGEGPGALAAATQVKNISINVDEHYKDTWTVSKDTAGESPLWTLTPQGSEILGTGAGAIVQFKLSNIITPLLPGLTLMYITHTDIPGYNDGVYTLAINKESAPLRIVSFKSDSGTRIDSNQQVTLSWQTWSADYCDLTLPDGGQQRYLASDDITVTPSENVKSEATATYTLTAYGKDGSETKPQSLTFYFNPVIIQSFTPSLSFSNGTEPVPLSWEVTDAENCHIEPGIGNVSSSGSCTVTPTKTTTYTLTAKGVGNEAKQNVHVVAGVLQSVTVKVGSRPQALAIAPDGKSVYVANMNSNTVSVIDTATNQVSHTIPVGIWPIDLAIAPDGKSVYVANNEDNTVSIIDTGSFLEIKSFTVSPKMPIDYGDSVTLAWETSAADYCTLEPGGIQVPVNGSKTFTPTVGNPYGDTKANESSEDIERSESALFDFSKPETEDSVYT
ncbi:MAG: beta-propeller fold lactonase family protein [Cyanobacteria bacterium P01_G01_bin.54]